MLPGKGADGRKHAASPLDKSAASYLCLLSLQTREAQVHHGVPWGLLVLSGRWVPPCQDLLKMEVATLTVRARCHGPQTAPPPQSLSWDSCFSSPGASLSPGPA